MRIALLAIALLASLVAAVDFSAELAIGLERNELWRSVEPLRQPPTELSCEKCFKVAALIEDLVTDPTTFKDIEAIAKDVCGDVFRNDTNDRTICEKFPELAKHLIAYGEVSGANVSNIMCADFAHMCTQPCCLTRTVPEQVHISFATSEVVGPSVDYRVAWTTLENVSGSEVMYKAMSEEQWKSSPATTRTYPIGGWIGTLYFAVMSNLAPDTTYVYRVGSGSVMRQFNFTTLPLAVGTPARPLRFLGVADMGLEANGRPTVEALRRHVETGEIDFIVHPGDVGYADADQHKWDLFMREMEPIMSRVPYMTGPGNHECIWYNCTAYKTRFWMPTPDPDAQGAMYYMMQLGSANTTLLMLDSETWYNTPNISPIQRDWLADAFSQSHTFRFVMHHRPMYCNNCGDFAAFLRSQVEETYQRNGVAAVMCGHKHNYERTLPVYNSSVVSTSAVNASAPIYFVNGGAGNPEGQSAIGDQLKPWCANYTLLRSFMRYTVTAQTSGQVDMFAEALRSTTDEVLDTVTITRFPRV